MNELGLLAPSLPGPVLYGVAALTLAILVVVMVRVRYTTAAFAIGSAWLRYVMSAFHEITYRPFAAGMSMNAAASMGVFALGLLTINPRHLTLRILTPFYLLIAIAIGSALVNGGPWPGLITVVVKYGYLIVMTLSVYGAMRRMREGEFMASMLWAFAPVLIYQAASVALGLGKQTETDLSAISYIGGYNHEAAFSVTLATCLVVACFTTRLNWLVKNAIIVAATAGIVLANYRTTLVAIAPLLLMYFGFSTLNRFPKRDRPFLVGALIVLASVAIGVVALMFTERFQDITTVASGDVNFFKPPDQYTVEESRLISGRPRIWSMYIYGWLQGGPMNYMFGFGPESYQEVFPLYAHNTLVNHLYEYGIVGVVGVLYLWLSMLVAALRVRHPARGILVGAHASFLVLNMATMPMWMVEGNILYGVICGYTFYLLSLQAPREAPARSTVGV